MMSPAFENRNLLVTEVAETASHAPPGPPLETWPG